MLLAQQTYGTGLDLAIVAFYLVGIMGFGALFGRSTRTTKDFFVSGQRFSAWLITASYIATLVGSYSFMKYSEAAYKYGFSATSTYTNDWFLMPLFMFGWLPIIYFARVMSVPEYFERRFDRSVRIAGTIIILLYMIGYIGYNLYTIGVALQPVLGLDVMTIVFITAIFCGVYVTSGGQTSVIMTDLAQGFLLLLVGLGVFALGIYHVGGWDAFWGALPADHKAGMARFNEPGGFNAVGIFWQDGMANSFAFYFMNQGIILRFLAAKSERESRRAAGYIALIMMPITAVAVCGAGWIGSAMHELGMLPAGTDPKHIFVTVSEVLCGPGAFGLVLAALTAALMSTIDTLINAVSAVTVNDIYRPYLRPGRSDRHYLRAARIISIAAAGIGIALVPLFLLSKSLYTAHAAFTAAITPPLVIVILLGVIWPRFGARAALITIVGGSLAIIASFLWPVLLVPIDHGIDLGEGSKFIRALYGLVVCGGIGVFAALASRPQPRERLAGLTIWSIRAAKRHFKGADNIKEATGKHLRLALAASEEAGESALLNSADLERLGAESGDLLYVCEKRWWLGGLHSVHARARADESLPPGEVRLAPAQIAAGRFAPERAVLVELII